METKKYTSQDVAKSLANKFLVDIGRALIKQNLSKSQERQLLRLADVGLIKLNKIVQCNKDN